MKGIIYTVFSDKYMHYTCPSRFLYTLSEEVDTHLKSITLREQEKHGHNRKTGSATNLHCDSMLSKSDN